MKKIKSLISAISIDKQTDDTLYNLQSKYKKSRSQLIRDLISEYAKPKTSVNKGLVREYYNDVNDPNYILKKYYQLISASYSASGIVIGLGLIPKKGKILIGLRRHPDTYVKNLTWSFPSAKFDRLNFENQLIKNIKSETNINCTAVNMIYARIIPDQLNENIKIIALYYHCRFVSGKLKAKNDYSQLKWVPVSDVTKYFTTSVSDEIIRYLGRFSL